MHARRGHRQAAAVVVVVDSSELLTTALHAAVRVTTFAQRLRMPTRYRQLTAAQPVVSLLPTRTLHVLQAASQAGRCHVSLWVAPESWNVTDMARSLLVPTACTRALRRPCCPCTSTFQRAIVATASLVFTHSRLDAVPVCHAPGRHPYRGSTDLPLLDLQGVGSSSMYHTGQDLSSVLVETSVYAPSGLL